MAPHGIILLAAFALGAIGKALFPHSSIRVATGAAALVVVGLMAYTRSWGSPLGNFLVTTGYLVGATFGVLAIKLLGWLWRKART